MKKVNQQFSFTNRIMVVLVAFAMLFVAASCDDDDEAPAVPAAPTLANASAITATGFTVSWTAVTGVEKYLLDISTVNTFATTVTGFNKKEVTGTTTNITGLTANTKYYFRLYAKKGSATSLASTIKDATTTN